MKGMFHTHNCAYDRTHVHLISLHETWKKKRHTAHIILSYLYTTCCNK